MEMESHTKFSNAYRSSYLFPQNNCLQKTQLHLTQSRTVGALYRDAATPTTLSCHPQREILLLL